MIRTFLATTALGLFVSTGAFAQTSAVPAAPTAPGYLAAAPEQVLATSVLGKTAYTGVDEEGEALGDVNDVVINPAGGAEALVVGVGGFLGIGEKDVAISFDRVSWSERDGQRILVVTATRDELQAAPEFKRTPVMDSAAATLPENADETADAPAAVTVPGQPTAGGVEATGTTPQMTDPDLPPVDPSTTASATPDEELKPVDPALLSASKLIGTPVRVADDTKIGEIGDVVMNKDGKVEAYVIDVGGFLGMGQKQVAMDATSVEVTADASGTMTIYSPFTREQLEAQPAYDAASASILKVQAQ